MQELFTNLMNLVDENAVSFFFKDTVTRNGTNVRIFSYHFAQYSDWIKPDALECRGIMFELDEDKNPVRIKCRPMEKFFNRDENPFTMNLDLSKVTEMMSKADGSLISTFDDNGILGVKSKTSLISQQAVESLQLLWDIRYKELRERCLELSQAGFTCNFEYVSPSNRIVLNYDEAQLILLNVRDTVSGEYVSTSMLRSDPILTRYLVEVYKMNNFSESDVEEIRASTGIEGYVFVMEDGMKFKLKTDWYSSLHRVKSSIESPKNLFMAIAYGNSDDLKPMFSDEPSLTKIETFEKIFLNYMNDSSEDIQHCITLISGKNRKDYVFAVQDYLKTSLRPELFSIAMQAYDGRELSALIERVVDVFIANHQKYIPEQYKKVYISQE